MGRGRYTQRLKEMGLVRGTRAWENQLRRFYYHEDKEKNAYKQSARRSDPEKKKLWRERWAKRYADPAFREKIRERDRKRNALRREYKNAKHREWYHKKQRRMPP